MGFSLITPHVALGHEQQNMEKCSQLQTNQKLNGLQVPILGSFISLQQTEVFKNLSNQGNYYCYVGDSMVQLWPENDVETHPWFQTFFKVALDYILYKLHNDIIYEQKSQTQWHLCMKGNCSTQRCVYIWRIQNKLQTLKMFPIYLFGMEHGNACKSIN